MGDLLDAMARGANTWELSRLIDKGADINKTDKDGKTPLYYACEYRHKEFAKLFIDKGADIDKADNDGITPLLYCCKSRLNHEMAHLLINSGADVNKADKNGHTPLLVACKEDRITIFEDLLHTVNNNNNTRVRLDVNKADNKGRTPLMMAYGVNNLRFTGLLLEAGADVNKPDNNGRTLLTQAYEDNEVNYIELYIEYGADMRQLVEKKGDGLMMDAINKGYTGIVKYLIDTGAEVDKLTERGSTPLMLASVRGHINIMKFLIDAGADVNKVNKANLTPLVAAANNGHLEAVKVLVSKGAKISDTMIENAKNNKYVPNINKYILIKAGINKGPKWKGMTRSDIEKFDALFESEENMRNFSCCPVCLQFTERSEACNYMTHNCSKHEYYHEELYGKYKNKEGIIAWCTICGRICIGHNHYELSRHDGPKPAVITGGDPFEKDCRVTSGGGGLPEKISRLRRLREKALELQAQVGKMGHEEAMNQLVETMWDTALTKNNKATNIITSKKWNISSANFPANAVANNKPLANINDPSKYVKPKVYVRGNANYAANNITGNDESPVIVFNHKAANGADYIHKPIAKDTVTMFLKGSGEKLGKCFDDKCGGLLWPKEIELAFADPKVADTVTEEDKAALNAYKERFNRWHSQSGGLRPRSTKRNSSTKKRRGGALFKEATNAQCVLPRSKGGKQRQTKRTKRIRR